jgi:hypothetical protein
VLNQAVPDVRAALYLDFDNVFSGLAKVDPEAALTFARSPGAWIQRLATSLVVKGARRWLVLRCYMNPAGYVPNLGASSERVYFSKFRQAFTQAGFEIIDCPRLTQTKNAADIRMVVDAVDALASSTRYDEFVIASADADMTPLLVRLRADDRRTTIISPSDAADAFTSVADRLIAADQLLALVQGEQPEDLLEEEEPIAELPTVSSALEAPLSGENVTAANADDSYSRFADMVWDIYQTETGPVNLASLSSSLRTEIGEIVNSSRWFGYRSFSKALASLALPNAHLSTYYLWDATRHEQPQTEDVEDDLPEPVQRVASLLGMPRLPQDTWPTVFRALAEYAANNHFNLTDATRLTRDGLRGQDVKVGRSALAFIIRGAAYGGAPLHRTPAPSPQEITEAFIANLIDRARSADLGLSEQDEIVLSHWIEGAPLPASGMHDASVEPQP